MTVGIRRFGSWEGHGTQPDTIRTQTRWSLARRSACQPAMSGLASTAAASGSRSDEEVRRFGDVGQRGSWTSQALTRRPATGDPDPQPPVPGAGRGVVQPAKGLLAEPDGVLQVEPGGARGGARRPARQSPGPAPCPRGRPTTATAPSATVEIALARGGTGEPHGGPPPPSTPRPRSCCRGGRRGREGAASPRP
jgi:hypothetical protein